MQCTTLYITRLTNYRSCGGENVNVKEKEKISRIVSHCLFISFYNVYYVTVSQFHSSTPHLLLFLPIAIYLYGNLIIFILVETPTKADEPRVHPVLDLVDVDEIIQVRVAHPLLVPVKSDTNLKGEKNREDSGSS